MHLSDMMESIFIQEPIRKLKNRFLKRIRREDLSQHGA
jgi:hypothetical protein